MCGSDYCGECARHALAEGVEDWARGRTHMMPDFGDFAQYRVAAGRRVESFLKALDHSIIKAAAYPDFEWADLSQLQGYLQGRRHDKPQIPDWYPCGHYFREELEEWRLDAYNAAKREDPVAAMGFPEFMLDVRPERVINWVAQRARDRFDDLRRKLPDFAAFVARHPYRGPMRPNGRGRAVKKAMANYRRGLVQRFLEGDTGFQRLGLVYGAIGITPPWWVHASTANRSVVVQHLKVAA